MSPTLLAELDRAVVDGAELALYLATGDVVFGTPVAVDAASVMVRERGQRGSRRARTRIPLARVRSARRLS